MHQQFVQEESCLCITNNLRGGEYLNSYLQPGRGTDCKCGGTFKYKKAIFFSLRFPNLLFPLLRFFHFHPPSLSLFFFVPPFSLCAYWGSRSGAYRTAVLSLKSQSLASGKNTSWALMQSGHTRSSALRLCFLDFYLKDKIMCRLVR